MRGVCGPVIGGLAGWPLYIALTTLNAPVEICSDCGRALRCTDAPRVSPNGMEGAVSGSVKAECAAGICEVGRALAVAGRAPTTDFARCKIDEAVEDVVDGGPISFGGGGGGRSLSLLDIVDALLGLKSED